MTPQPPPYSQPCAYAKAVMWVMGILIIMLGTLISTQGNTSKTTENNDRAIVAIKVDIEYIKKSVDEIKLAVARKP